MDIVVEDGTGRVTANAYISAATADDILSVNPQSKWSLLDQGSKESLLMWATRLLDERCRWSGRKMYASSGTAWPRSGVRDKYNQRIDDNLVPFQVCNATAILAEHLLNGNPEAANSANNVTEIKVDVIELRFDTETLPEKYPPEIKFILTGLATVMMGRGGPKRILKT